MAPSERIAAIREGVTRERLVVLTLTVAIAAVAWWRSDGDAATIFGALGVPALLYATVQFGDARRTIGNIEDIGDELEELQQISGELSSSTKRLEEQLSTRRIGVFPHFLPKIVELLDAARGEVVIFCDFPAYGEFSEPGAFRQYADAVRKKSAIVSLMCLDRNERQQLIGEQVRHGDWEHWRGSNEELIRKYLGVHAPQTSVETIKERKFVEVLGEGDTRTLDDEFAAAKKWATKMVMPLYFWIADKENAIFALAPFMQEEELEIGFRTIDPYLIGALNGIFERYRGMAGQTRRL